MNQSYSYNKIDMGLSFSKSFLILDDYSNSMVDLFKDTSSIHVNDAISRARGFKQKVAHGAILNCLLSRVAGTGLPGNSGLLIKCEIEYLSPFYIGDSLDFNAIVIQKSDSSNVIRVRFSFTRSKELISRGYYTAKLYE